MLIQISSLEEASADHHAIAWPDTFAGAPGPSEVGVNQTAQQIFVIDDDPAARDAAAVLLLSWGWRVRSFVSAEECLGEIEQDLPDCIVCDLNLPGMSGTDFVHTLAARGIERPVLMVTGALPGTPQVDRARASGAVNVVHKPYREAAMIAAVSRALASRSPT